jgi:hypothetical protein
MWAGFYEALFSPLLYQLSYLAILGQLFSVKTKTTI